MTKPKTRKTKTRTRATEYAAIGIGAVLLAVAFRQTNLKSQLDQMDERIKELEHEVGRAKAMRELEREVEN